MEEMTHSVATVSSVLTLSVKLNYFFRTNRRLTSEKIFFVILISFSIAIETRNIFLTRKIPYPRNVFANMHSLVTIINLFTVLIAHTGHHVLLSRQHRFEVLKTSPRLKSTRLNYSVISYACVVLCVVRGIASSLNAYYYRQTVFTWIYFNMTLKSLLDLGNHLILAQFASLLQMVRLVNDESLESMKYGLVDSHKHALLVELVRALNKSYGFQILLLFINYTLMIISSLYNVVAGGVAFRGKVKLLILNAVLHSCNLAFAWIQIAWTIRSCDLCKSNVDAFYRELFRLMRESKTLCSNKKLCLYVSMRKTVNFTACGFFNLGYPLITSIIAAATTYLVILVQFSIPKS